MSKSEYIAVVRVRGQVNLNNDVKKTFQGLNLFDKNWCVLVKKNDSNLGMIKKVKDYVTWGEPTEETVKQLFEKRGEATQSDSFIEYEKKKFKKYFRLSPPVKGFGRKGVKVSFQNGGAHGNRGEKINDLLGRMI